MATHSSVLAWRIPGMGEPGGLPSMGSPAMKETPAMQEMWVRSLGWKDPLEKEMATSPVFLSGKSHGQKSLEGYSPWGRKESNSTEVT